MINTLTFDDTDKTFKMSFNEYVKVDDKSVYDKGYDAGYDTGYDEITAIMDNVLDMEEFGGLRDKGYITNNRPSAMIANAGEWWDVFLRFSDGSKKFANWLSHYILYERFGHTLSVTNAACMFSGSNIIESPNVDTSKINNNAIVNGGCQGIFSNCANLKRVGTLDVRNASLRSGFNNCPKLTTIEKLIVSENTFFLYTFDLCKSLKEVRFEGTIGNPHGTSGKFRLMDCYDLSAKSIESALLCLKDYSGTDEANLYTIEMRNVLWDRIEAYSKAPTDSTWREYVANKGWNT